MQIIGSTRRHFFKTTAAAGAAAWVASRSIAHAQDAQPIRVGLVGCGRRGAGAARDCVSSAPNVSIVAIGDLFPDMLADARQKLTQLGDAFQATDDTCFAGWDAYQNVIATDCDLVILAAPPGFRPQHLRAAVEAGKHVFMEKPCAVDPVGVRAIIESSDTARNKGLAIVSGTQRRHQAPYVEIIKRIHDGAIGDLVAAQCYWMGDYGYYAAVLPEPGWSDMEAQIRNWNYYTWLSGDHIVEQHVHNIDIMNWAFDAHPVAAIGMGGRQQRTGPEYGHIYDHFSVEFEYPGGARVQSMCRQMYTPHRRVGENLVGTKGGANPGKEITGPKAYVFEDEATNPYVQEHTNLIASIRAGKPLNEGRALAESTMAAVMGRMAAYTGAEITWDYVMNESNLDLAPPTYEFGPRETPAVPVPKYTKKV
jgi:myo-inositol 2-dehydrogenase / D-chiro-inositol 1-dehydrogenase